jgi:hypothetical protein
VTADPLPDDLRDALTELRAYGGIEFSQVGRTIRHFPMLTRQSLSVSRSKRQLRDAGGC